MQDTSSAQLQAFILELKEMNSSSDQQSSSLQSQLLVLQSQLSRMGFENSSLQAQLHEQIRQSDEYERQLKAMQVWDPQPDYLACHIQIYSQYIFNTDYSNH